MGKLYRPEPTRYGRLVAAVGRLADASTERKGFWERVLKELKRSRRSGRAVNLHRLNRLTSPNDKVLVLGKLLGVGRLDHPVKVVAFDFSEAAYRKVRESGGEAIYLDQFISRGEPDVSGFKLMG
ncbi:MAG: 50S ribosomal protein L18e [Candidatus Caldarchaeales archaeon]